MATSHPLQLIGLFCIAAVSIIASAFSISAMLSLYTPWLTGIDFDTIAVTNVGNGQRSSLDDTASTILATEAAHSLPEIIERTHVRAFGTPEIPVTIHSRFIRMGDKRDLQLAVDPYDNPYQTANETFVSSVEVDLVDTGFDIARDAWAGESVRNHAFVFTLNGRPYMGFAVTYMSTQTTSLRGVHHDTNNALWSSFAGQNHSVGGKTYAVPSYFLSWVVAPQ